MTTISAKTIAYSQHAQRPDLKLWTGLLRYPRFIHAELMTHRLLSRNAASSRAIPVHKLIEDVVNDPAVPRHWGKNQKGMQATEECDELVKIGIEFQEGDGYSDIKRDNRTAWLMARDAAVEWAQKFSDAGYHKQVVNRLLEPFAHITVVVSATQWSNFLALRDHPDAEPHIALLAREIRNCLETDKPQILQPGEWHLPFIERHDRSAAITRAMTIDLGIDDRNKLANNLMIKLAVARCASTSYKTVDGFDMTLERAIDLHDKLVAAKPLHASPAEHVAQADEIDDRSGVTKGNWMRPDQHGNFEGFRQYRKMLPFECL